jgi:lipopolysaccharide assembly protein A
VRIVTWAIRLLVFVLLIAFAAKNADPVTLRFYFDLALQAPLVVLLFAFFALGALFGVLALLGTLLRQRRELGVLRRRAPPEPPAEPSMPEL